MHADRSTLEFKDARTTVACILRSFFHVVSPSARLPAQHASRRAEPRRAERFRSVLEYARRARVWKRSPRAGGRATSRRATSGRASTERRTVSSRPSAVVAASSSLARSQCRDRVYASRTRSKIHHHHDDDRQCPPRTRPISRRTESLGLRSIDRNSS